MSDSEKLKAVMSILNDEKSVKVATLAEKLGVSVITVRRYLSKLEKEGFLTKTHGGAVLNEKSDVFIKDTYINNLEYKERIADFATTLIENRDSIFIGGGTTCYLFAKKLKLFKGISIVTTSLNAAYELYPFIKNIYFIGGELISNKGVFYTGGPKIASELANIYVNKAFISVSGIEMNAGLTIHELNQLSMLQTVPKITKETFILADSTKFGFLSAHQLGPINMADAVITNKNIDPIYHEFFAKRNVKLFIADS